MDIEQMTQVSHYLLVLSILFAIAAIIIFFVLDIPRCWNMIIGTHSTRLHIVKQHKKTKRKKGQEKEDKNSNMQREKDSEETILLSKYRAQQKRRKQVLSKKETALLNVKTEETLLLRGTIKEQESEETMLLASNIEEKSIKEQKLEKEETKYQKTVPLCLETNLCDSAESKLTAQLDMEGMILIQDIVYMHFCN